MRALLFIRRLHMYLGIALIPWFFMYALGAFVLNHRPLVDGWFKSDKPEWTQRFQREYHRPVPAGQDNLRPAAAEILQDLGLDGRSFWVGRPNPNQLNIHAFKFLSATRVTYFVDQGRVVAEDQAFRLDRLFVGMHERAGFGQMPWLTKVWGGIVDLVGLAVLAWAISGLYLWWKTHQRHLGSGLALAAGVICFIVLVAVL